MQSFIDRRAVLSLKKRQNNLSNNLPNQVHVSLVETGQNVTPAEQQSLLSKSITQPNSPRVSVTQ